MDQDEDSPHPLLEKPEVKAVMDELKILKLILSDNGRADIHELSHAYYEWDEGMILRPEVIVALTLKVVNELPQLFGLKPA